MTPISAFEEFRKVSKADGIVDTSAWNIVLVRIDSRATEVKGEEAIGKRLFGSRVGKKLDLLDVDRGTG